MLRGDMVPMGTVCVTQNQVGGPEESCPRTPCKHGAQGDSVCRTELGKKTRKILPKDTLLRGDMVPKWTVCVKKNQVGKPEGSCPGHLARARQGAQGDSVCCTELGRRIRRILPKDTLKGRQGAQEDSVSHRIRKEDVHCTPC
jgi:hypothetical protein